MTIFNEGIPVKPKVLPAAMVISVPFSLGFKPADELAVARLRLEPVGTVTAWLILIAPVLELPILMVPPVMVANSAVLI